MAPTGLRRIPREWRRFWAAVLTVAVVGTIAVLATVGDPPTPLYVTQVFVGLVIGAALVGRIVWALVSIVRQPGLGSGRKAGWVLLCLVFPLGGAQAWFTWSRRAYGRACPAAPHR